MRQVVASGWLSQGRKAEELEQVVAAFVGARHAVATSSCTTALHLALTCMGVNRGDEVICPSYSFVATANAILYCGAVPVLVDIEGDSFNLDPGRTEAAINSRTKGILLVHQLGLPADIDAFKEIASRHGLWLVEDAAAAIGATYGGRPIGGHGLPACISFHPRKIITTGEGGVITTDDDELCARLRRLRNHGVSMDTFRRDQSGEVVFEAYTELGYNYRMSDLHAAVGVEQMKKLGRAVALRREKAHRYDQLLADLDVERPAEPGKARHNFTTYQALLPRRLQAERDGIIARAQAGGITLRRGIPPIHRQQYFERLFGPQSLPVTEDVSGRALFLPLYPDLSGDDQERVVRVLADAMDEAAAGLAEGRGS